jgi:23S rRNA (adenine2503-C2)-methyltransferase
MMPKGNKNLETFLNEWIEQGKIYGGEDGFGLQFSINTLNEDDRNEMFRGRSRSLQEIGEIIDRLPMPKKRKYTLNFAVTSKSNLDPEVMDRLFDKEKCIVKITPIHETVEAVDQGYEIVKNFDVYEQFEKPLVAAGWQVIVFVPSEEEDKDRITCGNSLIAKASK